MKKGTRKGAKGKKQTADVKNSTVKDHEDVALKITAQYFGDVMLLRFELKVK